MTKPTGLEILKNSGYQWAKEAAELWERDIERLQLYFKQNQALRQGYWEKDFNERSRLMNVANKIQRDADEKFKEWNER